jgi:hypothetical protein
LPVGPETTLKTVAQLAHLEAGQYKNGSFFTGAHHKKNGLKKKHICFRAIVVLSRLGMFAWLPE